jgi:hypothetical protein
MVVAPVLSTSRVAESQAAAAILYGHGPMSKLFYFKRSPQQKDASEGSAVFFLLAASCG